MAMNDSNSQDQALLLTVLVNGEPQLEYHRSRPLSAFQQEGLHRMDQQMNRGIVLGGTRLDQPDMLQRAQFVAIQVIEAMRGGQDAMTAAGCAWLATRLPDLTQVRARLVDGGFSAELIFNKPYVREVDVKITPRRLS